MSDTNSTPNVEETPEPVAATEPVSVPEESPSDSSLRGVIHGLEVHSLPLREQLKRMWPLGFIEKRG